MSYFNYNNPSNMLGGYQSQSPYQQHLPPRPQPVGQGYYGTQQQAYKGSYEYKKQMLAQQQQQQAPMLKRSTSNSMPLAPIDMSGDSYHPDINKVDQSQIQNMQMYMQQQKQLRQQQKNLLRELKNVEKQNRQYREDKIFKLMEAAQKKKHVKKIPPPLVPLPYHLIPKKLIGDLKIKPPLQIITGKEDKSKKLTKKQKEQMINLGLMDIEVYERLYDPETNKYIDQQTEISGSRFGSEYRQKALKPMQQGQFLGLPRNEDEVTKILISKEDQLRDKMGRQVVFGADNRPIMTIPGEEDMFADQNLIDMRSEQTQEEPLIDRLRQELAVDKQKQLLLESELAIPKFEKEEKVEVAEEDVSEDESGGEDEADQKNKAKTEQYQKIKDRLKKGKFSKSTEIRGGRKLAVIFKLVTSLVQILDEVKQTRIQYRDQGITDFKNALPLYNEVLRGWLIKCVKTPVLTIIRQPDVNMDFIPLEGGLMRDKVRRERFLFLRIRVNTIFQQLILNSTPKSFPQPLMTFMNSFMTEGGFVPYDFLTEFEQDVLEFDTSDALQDFGPKQKFLFIGSFILSQYLIDRILMRPAENGFNTDISEKAEKNLLILGALIHGIFADLMYDTFKEILIRKKILLANESNKKEIVQEFIYARYRYSKTLPAMQVLEYAFEENTSNPEDNNQEWWQEMKVQCSKFIVLIYQLLEE